MSAANKEGAMVATLTIPSLFNIIVPIFAPLLLLTSTDYIMLAQALKVVKKISSEYDIKNKIH